MSDDVIQADRQRAHDVVLRNLIAAHDDEAPWMREALAPILGGQEDGHYMVEQFAAHRIAATPAPDSEKLREALTPSGDTKAAYLGEFKFGVMFPSLDEDDDEPVPHPVTVPWDTIKEIMAAIACRAGATP